MSLYGQGETNDGDSASRQAIELPTRDGAPHGPGTGPLCMPMPMPLEHTDHAILNLDLESQQTGDSMKCSSMRELLGANT
jgi:hypothetical protein